MICSPCLACICVLTDMHAHVHARQRRMASKLILQTAGNYKTRGNYCRPLHLMSFKYIYAHTSELTETCQTEAQNLLSITYSTRSTNIQ